MSRNDGPTAPNKVPTGADTFAGVKGNLRYIFWNKLWATLIVFAVGVAVGTIFCASINAALAHAG